MTKILTIANTSEDMGHSLLLGMQKSLGRQFGSFLEN